MSENRIPLSISIVTYKTEPNILKTVLSCIVDSSLPSQAYVVDNSPSDVLREIAETHRATYLYPGNNLGFGRGHNLALGIVGCDSKYHLILNADVSFKSKVLEELYNFMELNPTIGWVMPNVLNPDGSRQELCKRLPTPWNLFNRRFFRGNTITLFENNRDRFRCRDLDLSKPRCIPNLSGCFAFVRTSAVQAVNGFDERFFLYLEDTDLVRRIGEISFTVFYPYVDICHERGRGSYRDFRLLGRHMYSTLQYFAKWGWFIDRKRTHINQILARNNCDIAVPAQFVG